MSQKQNEKDTFLLVNTKVLPAAFAKVAEAKRLLALGEARHIQEAAKRLGISRSVFYKYRDYVFAYDGGDLGKTVTFALSLRDAPGLLSDVLSLIAESGANVLTINQTIPLHNTANITVTLREPAAGMTDCFERVAALDGVFAFKILGRG